MAQAATSSGTDREQLRAERKLRLIASSEEGLSIDMTPDGVYGFTYSPGTEGVPLYLNHTFQSFEVHKLFNGSLHLIGYMTPADAAAFETSRDNAELKLYPEPFNDAQKFVSVPQERVLKAKSVSREQGNSLPILCLAKP